MEGQLLPLVVLAGFLVTSIMYLARLILPGLFVGEDEWQKTKRTLTAIVMAGLLVLVNLKFQWPGLSQFLALWLAAYSTAEGLHTVASRASKLRKGET